MEKLGIDLKLIIFQIINFSLLLFVLAKFLYKPILKILDERKKKIAESLANAQKIDEELAKLEEKKGKEIEKAKEAGRSILEEMRVEGEKQRVETLTRAKEEAEKIAQRAKEQLDLEKEKLREELKAELVDLSIAMTEKLLEKKIGKEKKEDLISSTLQTIRKEARKVSSGPSSLVEGRLSPKTLSDFLALLKRAQNLKFLPQILGNLEEKILTPAEVITASPLKADEQKKIRTTLEEVFGKGLKIKFVVNPKIMGGIVIKVADKVLDNSLLGKARQLKESL